MCEKLQKIVRCMNNVCVCVHTVAVEDRKGFTGCSHSLIVLQEFCAMCVSEDDVSYHVVSKNTEVCPPNPPSYTNTQPNTQQRQWESTGWPFMYAVVCDPYLFLWVLQAASHHHVTHRRTEGPWTLTLCTATAVRGKNLLPHNTQCSFLSLSLSIYIHLFRHSFFTTENNCFCSKTYFHTGL